MRIRTARMFSGDFTGLCRHSTRFALSFAAVLIPGPAHGVRAVQRRSLCSADRGERPNRRVARNHASSVPFRRTLFEIMKSFLTSRRFAAAVVFLACVVFVSAAGFSKRGHGKGKEKRDERSSPVVSKDPIVINAARMIGEGRQIFRFDTYGDEAFWGDTLLLHQAIEGTNFGGVGPGLSPSAALALGLKVDADALPPKVLNQLKRGQLDLNDPATTLALLKLDAVVGVKGFFNSDKSLRSVGLTCAVCHSTVNDSVAPGIGQRLDGWANRDLNSGAIIAFAPNVKPLTDLLKIAIPSVDDAQVRAVLN